MDDLLKYAGELAGLIVIGLSGVMWLNRRLEALRELISTNLLQQAVQDAQIKANLEALDARINSNREGNIYCRERTQQEIDRLEQNLDSEIRRVSDRLEQITGWLAKNTEFTPRR